MLLEKSPDLVRLFTMDENNATPLHIACLKGHFEVVDALLNTVRKGISSLSLYSHLVPEHGA